MSVSHSKRVVSITNVWIKLKNPQGLIQRPSKKTPYTTMHPIASVLSKINGDEFDNIQFLARIVPQMALPKNHRFYKPGSLKNMLHYYPNSLCKDLENCYDFHETCNIPSNCFHTSIIFGEYLPQYILERQKEFEKDYLIRPQGRYVIVTYILKKKNFDVKKRKHNPDLDSQNKRFRCSEFSDEED